MLAIRNALTWTQKIREATYTAGGDWRRSIRLRPLSGLLNLAFFATNILVRTSLQLQVPSNTDFREETSQNACGEVSGSPA